MSAIAFASALFAIWGAFSSRTGPALAGVAFAILFLAYQIGVRP